MTIIKCLRNLLLLTFVFLSALPLLASEPWLLGEQEFNGLCKLTSPDGNWQLWCRKGNYDEIKERGTFDFKINRPNDWSFRLSLPQHRIIHGKGTFTVPLLAKDAGGRLYGLSDFYGWSSLSLSGWRRYYEPGVTNITKVIIPYYPSLPECRMSYVDFISSPTVMSYEVESGWTSLKSIDGVVYEAVEGSWGAGQEPDQIKLCAFPAGRKGTFRIPDSVGCVEFYVFEHTSLSKLIIGPNLRGYDLLGTPGAYYSELIDKPLQFEIEGNENLETDGADLYYVFHSHDGMKYRELVMEGYGLRRALVDTYQFNVDEGKEEDYPFLYKHPAKRYIFKGEECLGMDGIGIYDYDVDWRSLLISQDELTLDYSEVKGFRWSSIACNFISDSQQQLTIILPKQVGDFMRLHEESCRYQRPTFMGTAKKVIIDIYWPADVPFVRTELCRDCFSAERSNITGTLHIGKNAGSWPEYVGCLKVVKDGGVPPSSGGEVPTPATKRLVQAEATHGKVLGTGVYTSGEEIYLRAVADRGYVFAGWELIGAEFPLGIDEREPNLTFTMGDSPVLAKALFIPKSEDYAEINILEGNFRADYLVDDPFSSVTLSVESASLPTLKVTGLPAGLKFTPNALTVGDVTYPANTIYGTPTKRGVYTIVVDVTTASGIKISRSWSVAVRSEDDHAVRTTYDTSLGKTSGEGIYTAGKRFTLKATPSNDAVFAGWSVEGIDLSNAGTDLRKASITLTMGNEDVHAEARFVSKEEDSHINLLINGEAIDADDTYTFSSEEVLTVALESFSTPKCSFSGLPSGLKYNASSGTISGNAKKPGVYTVKARLTNGSVKKALVRTFRIEVPNQMAANSYFPEGLANAPGERYVAYAGVQTFEAPDLKPSNGMKASVSGLPSGMKYNATTGLITGKASKTGTYTVTVRVGQDTSTFTLEVLPLPSWIIATFNGYGAQPSSTFLPSDHDAEIDHADSLTTPHCLTLTVAANGRITVENSYNRSGYATTQLDRWFSDGFTRAEVDDQGKVTFLLETEVATLYFPQEAIEANLPIDGFSSDGCLWYLWRNQWDQDSSLEKLEESLRGRTVQSELNTSNLKRVELSFTAKGSVNAKCTLASGVVRSAKGTLVVEDSDSGLLGLNILLPGGSFLRGVLTIDSEGEITDIAWWETAPTRN